MEQTIFKNKPFYYLLISYLIILICWNSFTVTKGVLIGIVPIVIQLILLYLIFDKNKFAKKGIKIWSIIIVLANAISLFAKLLKIVLGDEIIIVDLLNKFIFLSAGILIYLSNEKYTEIVKTDN